MQRDYWKVRHHLKRLPKLDNPVLVEGLPGIGNVGKITVDFLIDELNAKPLYTFRSYTFPNSAFITDQNLISLPSITLYYAKRKGQQQDLLLLAGDVQPNHEVSCYSFAEIVLETLAQFGGRELITIGGIGLMDIPDVPQVHCTANTKKIISRYGKYGTLNTDLYGYVGPIIGVTGLLVGLAEEYEMEGISLLADTYGHPMSMGIDGSREILKLLISRFGFSITRKQMDAEIEKVRAELSKQKEDQQPQQDAHSGGQECAEETHYIG